MQFPREVYEPIACNASRSVIENMAETLARKLDFRQSRFAMSINAEREMVDLIKRLDGRVIDPPIINSGEAPGEDDSLIVFDDKHFTVFHFRNPLMSQKLEDSHAMFLGHEIGHRFLHYPVVRMARGVQAGKPLVMVAQRHPSERNEAQRRCDIEAY